MKIIVILFFAFNIAALSYSQEKQISISSSSKSESHVLDLNLVYDKRTGEKVSVKEFRKLVKGNPRLYLEREYDARGNISRYIYDPNNPNAPLKRYPYSIAPKGKPYPNFIVNTTDGEQLELEKLRGKLVMVRFELFSSGFRFKKQEIEELNNNINALGIEDQIEAIIIFRGSKDEIEREFSLKNSNFKLVPDGDKFFNKYQIDRFPMTVLIDKKGNLIDYFKYSEDIDFKNHL
ncbi:MAG: redoxin domain-containing protein [Bacteroidia bacterium]|nr:redoxin domain-containing protein [Bacteroidia bacterium]